MKLNKTLMIAALIAGTVFAADYAVRAQDSTNTPPAGARPPGGGRGRGMNLDNIATQLQLTDDQKTKVKPILSDMQQKMQDLRGDTTLDAAAKRSKAKEVRDDATSKLKEILTPDQLDKWEKLTTNRRPPGGAGAPPPATPPATPPAQQ